MLTDKDRKQSKNVPYSYPVAYAMKGNSMTNKHLEFLVDKVRNELKERRIQFSVKHMMVNGTNLLLKTRKARL